MTTLESNKSLSKINRCSLAALPKGNLCLPSSICDSVRSRRRRRARLHSAMAAAPREREPVLPSGAKLIQFPLFPAEARPVSNDMARSALFSCVQGVDRRVLHNAVLATVGDVKIEFTGQQLNQDDHDVLMQLVFMARDIRLGQFVVVSAYAILKGLGPALSIWSSLCKELGGRDVLSVLIRGALRRLFLGTAWMFLISRQVHR